MKKLIFQAKTFDQLTLEELYRLLQLRQEVFIVEQDCPYLDCDDKDQQSWHVLGKDEAGIIHGYTRLVPPGMSYDQYCSIGRVITSSTYRRVGVGKELMHFSINKIKQLWQEHEIKISAQVYILNFYESFGFEPVGEEYLEDDIPHKAMILK